MPEGTPYYATNRNAMSTADVCSYLAEELSVLSRPGVTNGHRRKMLKKLGLV